jgi:hypothetical protein
MDAEHSMSAVYVGATPVVRCVDRTYGGGPIQTGRQSGPSRQFGKRMASPVAATHFESPPATTSKSSAWTRPCASNQPAASSESDHPNDSRI